VDRDIDANTKRRIYAGKPNWRVLGSIVVR
jgi:hypothetical protein